MQKLEMLQLLNEKVQKCTKCPELVEGRLQTVFGEGDPNSKVVFVGEAPGRDEAESGRPFVGKAGKLLDNILSAAGLKRDDVYILNIVKCRPPGNRNPEPSECANCKPFLDLQLKVISPKFIVALGTVAAQNLLGVSTGITNLRNQNWHSIENPIKAKVLCTYHPAFLLRNPAAKKDVWEDIQKLMAEL